MRKTTDPFREKNLTTLVHQRPRVELEMKGREGRKVKRRRRKRRSRGGRRIRRRRRRGGGGRRGEKTE